MLKALRPYLILAGIAVLLWTPNLVIDFGRGDSLGDNLIWSTDFSRLFADGVLYPRWLPGSFDGLGSPAFYFYPPLPFWTTALVSAATSGWAGAMLQLKLAALVALAVSGWAAFAWLRTQTSAGKAVVGAVIYMAAPYHLIDDFVRGAFAEFFAVAVIPLVALGLLHTARGARRGPVILAIGYALLLLSHLPMALLTSILLVAPYGLFLLWRLREGRAVFALKAGAGLAAGVGLAAIYLVPALTLQGAISSEYLWSGAFQPDRHLFVNPQAWSNPFEPFLALMSLLETGLAALIGLRAWRRGERRPIFWAALTGAVCAAIAGVVPGLWDIPLLSKVQFPWRGMAVQEFALVTLLATSAATTARELAVLAAVVALANPGLIYAAKNIAIGQPDAGRMPAADIATLLRDRYDAPEYLPKGMLAFVGAQPTPRLPLETIAAAPLAVGPGVVSARDDPVTGEVHLLLAPGGRAGPIVLRRFYFPSWRVRCDGHDVAASATGAARLIGFAPPAGAAECDATIGRTAQEGGGQLLALASLALIGLYSLWALAGRVRRLDAATPPS